MVKHKKRRKRKAKNSSRSQPPASVTKKRPKWVLAPAAVVCVGIACFLLLKMWPGPDSSLLTQEEKIAVLKREEMQLAQQLLRDFPGNDATVSFVGSVYGQHGNNTEAVKFLNKALELNPNRPDVYDALGWVAFTKGAYGESITHWKKALEIGAKLPSLRSSIAFSLMAIDRGSEAIEQLEKNIQIFPKSVYSHFLLGQAYLQQKDYENAKKHYQIAIELDQNYVNAYYGLFTACTRLKQQAKAREYMAVFKKLKAEEMKFQKARDGAYNDMVTMRQTVAENHIKAAQIYLAQDQSDRAEELLEKAIKLDPDNVKYKQFYQSIKNRK